MASRGGVYVLYQKSKHTSENVFERRLDIGRVQCGGFNERQAVLSWALAEVTGWWRRWRIASNHTHSRMLLPPQ